MSGSSFDPYYKWLGIPPAEQPPDHYRLLGVPRFEQDPDVIDMAAARQMSHLRTLASGTRVKESQRLLNEVATARAVLLNPERKREYDLQLEGAVALTTSVQPTRTVQAAPPLAPFAQSRTRQHRRSRFSSASAKSLLALSAGVVVLFIGYLAFRNPNQTDAGSGKPEDQEMDLSRDSVRTATQSETTTVPPAIAPFDSERASSLQAAWAKQLGVPVRLENSIGMQFVLVPPGEFTMGNAKTARHVTLTKPMYLGVHEVTQQQYQAVMQNNPSHFQGDDHPVDSIAWTDALAFCSTLAAIEDEQGAGRTYRLPTEAEWEFACRAGGASIYSFGNDPSLANDFAWDASNSQKTTHPVGQKLANAFGFFDMHGNVWEWCSDFVSESVVESSTEPSLDPLVDPNGPTVGPNRVARGGCWSDAVNPCASRHTKLAVRGRGHGFRVAMAVRKGEASDGATAQGRRIAPRGDPPPTVAYPFDSTLAKTHQLSWAEHLGTPVEVENSLGMKLRFVPPGEFPMGSESGAEDERPVHKVTLSKGFYLGALEVTQEQYRKVMQNVTDGRWSKRRADPDDGRRFPIDNVAWHDAVEFCRRLSTWPEEARQGRNYRLPTEAEWEYASRAGTMTRWAFGDDVAMLPQHEWYNEQGRSSRYVSIHFVGTKTSNPWGFHDLDGNVWEWCSDRYGAYRKDDVVDPQGPDSGAHRVVRGGCWFVTWNECRNTKRSNSGMRTHRRRLIGFRVAFTVPD